MKVNIYLNNVFNQASIDIKDTENEKQFARRVEDKLRARKNRSLRKKIEKYGGRAVSSDGRIRIELK